MSRFQKLSLGALVATYVMVAIGAAVRGTGSGMGCPDWPLCHGQIIPPLGNTQAWIEWLHRGWGVLVGFIALAVAIVAIRSHRRQRSVVVASIAALVLTGFQAYLGKITVDTGNAGEWVTAHLATAMLLLAVFGFITVRARYPDAAPGRGTSQRLTLVTALAAASVYALLLFGAHVTATGSGLIYPDWPLFGGSLLPDYSTDAGVAALQTSHFLHRFVAAIVAVIVVGAAVTAWRAARRPDAARRMPGAEILLGLVGTAAALYAIEVIVGALQIFTSLASWAVTLHLALAAAVWTLLAVGVFHAYFEARFASPVPATDGGPVGGRTADETGTTDIDSGRARRTVGERVNAYVALTKPRIIELLLVTTVPAMVLAAVRETPGMDLARFGWLVGFTLIGGTLAAGSANAINCYLDRDIDLLMTRTRRRPLPAHTVAPEDALAFGLALGVVAFAILAFFVNLVAAFLTLLAIAFYVVVYTMLLKRSTSQNIVLGGAAGALPPVIGWAAVTGDIGLPALVLFAIVFYWTPPHFWALSLRIRGDYAAANVPMLPVTHGVPETTRQIALYTMLMVCLTLVFFAVAHMGLVYLAGALLLGGLFLFQALAMWREGTDRRGVRLYKFSIAYLSGLFALVALDAIVFLPLG
ncbi:MAG: heme o synthase [Chloroflexota bacterium]|nr:heme o synthase [Chloroflexota bacterium]